LNVVPTDYQLWGCIRSDDVKYAIGCVSNTSIGLTITIVEW
jgi:hypothetical protein